MQHHPWLQTSHHTSNAAQTMIHVVWAIAISLQPQAGPSTQPGRQTDKQGTKGRGWGTTTITTDDGRDWGARGIYAGAKADTGKGGTNNDGSGDVPWALKGANRDADTPTPASDCSQGGLWVLPSNDDGEDSMNAQDDHKDLNSTDHDHSSTLNHRRERLLRGWKQGATRRGRGRG